MGLVIAVATIAGYGAITWIVAIRGAGHGSVLTDACAVLVFALLVGAAWRRKRDESPERRRERARRGKIISSVTAILAALIPLSVKVLEDLGRLELLAPVVAILLGLHFLAFARLFPAWIYYITSALLLALAAAGLFVAAGPGRVLLVGLGAAGILWLTCVAVLIWPETRRRPPVARGAALGPDPLRPLA